MEANSKFIEWLIENETQYRISKETGIPQQTISKIVRGERKIENLSLRVASALTDYAKRIYPDK
ncbi:XRE family transcriptional regulator [Streptococcus sp. zg-JUN1979]|uniref:XRE family transcriptional regulator n=1 Tax=Streptococcus sp. zg-JUN1979 TaxID=3391450 RepID=UPI0039A51440